MVKQASITSFFGGSGKKGSSHTGPKQASIKSFLGGGGDKDGRKKPTKSKAATSNHNGSAGSFKSGKKKVVAQSVPDNTETTTTEDKTEKKDRELEREETEHEKVAPSAVKFNDKDKGNDNDEDKDESNEKNHDRDKENKESISTSKKAVAGNKRKTWAKLRPASSSQKKSRFREGIRCAPSSSSDLVDTDEEDGLTRHDDDDTSATGPMHESSSDDEDEIESKKDGNDASDATRRNKELSIAKSSRKKVKVDSEDSKDAEKDAPFEKLNGTTVKKLKSKRTIKKTVIKHVEDSDTKGEDESDNENDSSSSDSTSSSDSEASLSSSQHDETEEELEYESEDDEDGEKDSEKSLSKPSKGKNKENISSKTQKKLNMSSSRKKSSKKKRTVNEALKDTKVTRTSSASSGGFKTDEQLLECSSDKEKEKEKEKMIVLWEKDQPVPYAALCHTFSCIEEVSGRLAIQEMLTDLLRRIILLSSSSSKDEEMEALTPKKSGNMTENKSKTTDVGVSANDSKNKKKNKSNTELVGDLTLDLKDVIYLASNTVAPAYECVELGVGDAILIKAIGEAYGTSPSMIKQKYDKEGDLGTVAMNAKGKQRTLGFGLKPRPLLAREILSVFRQIATTTGSQSQKWKVDKIKGLLVRAVGEEAKYVIRGLQGKLRIGLAQSTVLISLAHAVYLTPPTKTYAEGEKTMDSKENEEFLKKIAKEETDEVYPENARKLCNIKTPCDEKMECAVNIVKKAYSELPSFDALIDAALTAPLYKMHQMCTLKPGIPVEPMLAKPTKSIQEVLKRLTGLRFTCEYKYDGERAQVHMTPDGTTKVFSRNLLNTSEKFPEVPLYSVEACASTNVQSFVLDTEVVAYNRETKQFVPFQILSTRKRTEESADNVTVQVIVQAFDLMYINGRSLLDRTLSERRDLMKKYFLPIEGKFQYATSMDHTEDGTTTALEEFLDAAVKGQCEGLMVKTLDDNANYEPSRRSLNWLKLKKDYLEGLGDSFDLVPIGAFYGKGKRTGFYGAYLLACYDEDTEEYQSVCKIGTGFSEEDLKSLAEGLNQYIIQEKSSQYNVSETLQCDVWFETVQVWEVKAADLSKSSTHRGAVDKTGETGRGIGLRFPRFERFREDKKPEQATTSDQILDMYYAQDTIVSRGTGVGDGMDDDGI